jgi:hypothetical protein
MTPYKLEVETNRTSLLCRNRDGHHNMELRTHNRTTHKTKKMNNTDPIKNLG